MRVAGAAAHREAVEHLRQHLIAGAGGVVADHVRVRAARGEHLDRGVAGVDVFGRGVQPPPFGQVGWPSVTSRMYFAGGTTSGSSGGAVN